MAKKTSTDALLADCEPYFLDGVQTIAEFVRRTHEILQMAVDRHWDPLVEGLGSPKDLLPRDYSIPDKLQKAKPGEEIELGVCLKIPNVLEACFSRYWQPGERPGIRACIYGLGGKKLGALGAAIDNDLKEYPWPEPEEAWDSEADSNGYWFWRELSDSEVSQLDSLLDELITYFIDLLAKVGGVRKFLK
ncbi:MAG: hypothetical protein ABSH47_25285 [Bryobacteraceae bacterium]